MNALANSYDTVLYPSYTHPQTHPDRMAVVGRLHGLTTAPVTRCRVLDVGCGNGSNLVPMAYALPESEFVGVDLAALPIAQGQEMIRDLGLRNVRLVPTSLTEVNEDWGKFDYIIAHGFYSWVPPNIQERLLALCRSALTPHGVAFISYNALPGGHLRKMVSEMMLFHTRDIVEPQEKVGQAVALLRFLAEGQEKPDPYRLWMNAELNTVTKHEEGHLYHDELSPFNEPLYFVQFIERAARHELQFVAEADYFEMFDHAFPESVRQTLNQLGHNRILRDQYLDFLKCRRFRQTILCHREVNVCQEAQQAAVASFAVSATTAPANGLNETVKAAPYGFETPKGKFETNYALGKATMAILQENWPRPLPFDELLARSMERLNNDPSFDRQDPSHGDRLSGFLLQLYGSGFVNFRTMIPQFTSSVSECPKASPIARWQAQRGNVATSLLHTAVKLEDELARSLLIWLDGSCNQAALVEKVRQLLSSKNALEPSDDEQKVEAKLKADLKRNLETIARIGLLES